MLTSMCIYRHNKYTQYTHILCEQKLLFWMRLIAINGLTALINISEVSLTQGSATFNAKRAIFAPFLSNKIHVEPQNI